ncbi:MAG: LysM peptidoglycan-binding domain-containing protein [Dehalococcoidia bacterium]
MSGPAKAYLMTEKNERIDCLFNPSQLEISKANTWFGPKVAGKGAPDLVFKQGTSGTLNMTLMFDTTDTGRPVTDHTERLLDLMRVDADLGEGTDPKSKTGRPPWVRFHWGKLISFKAVLKSLKVTFTFFSMDGVPLRASCVVSMEQFANEAQWPLQNPTSGTPDPHTVHQVRRGETLDRISTLRYGDPTQWRLIAEANHILDPLRVEPGTILLIPRVEAVLRG